MSLHPPQVARDSAGLLLRKPSFVGHDNDHVLVGLPEYMHEHCQNEKNSTIVVIIKNIQKVTKSYEKLRKSYEKFGLS